MHIEDSEESGTKEEEDEAVLGLLLPAVRHLMERSYPVEDHKAQRERMHNLPPHFEESGIGFQS